MDMEWSVMPCKEIEVTIDYKMSLYKHDDKSNGELGLKGYHWEL